MLSKIHGGKADVRTIGYLQHNMVGTSNVKIILQKCIPS